MTTITAASADTFGDKALGTTRRARKFDLTLVLALAVLAVVVLFALFPRVFTGHSPAVGETEDRFQSPNLTYWFGTDHLGRDVFARVVHGAESSVTSALLAVSIALVVGSLLGLLAGFLGGWADTVISRIIDALLAIPNFLLAVTIVTALGFSTTNAAIAAGVSAIAVFTRLMRSEVFRIRNQTFVEAAGLVGGSRGYILLAHILPNAYRPVLALAVLQFGISIITIAGLSFLGYGDGPPASDWGLMVAAGREYMNIASWLVLFPGAAIVVTVLALNRLSQQIRGGDR